MPREPEIALTPAELSAEEDRRVTDRAVRLGFLALFIYLSVQLVLPFVKLAIWSVIIAVALFPVYRHLVGLTGGRQRLAAAIVTFTALALVVGPVAVLATSLVDTASAIAASIHEGGIKIPSPPDGLAEWPLIGEQLARTWSLASENLQAALNQFWPEPRATAAAVARKLSALGGDMVLFLVAILLSGFLYRAGPKIVEAARLFVSRLVAPRGDALVQMAGATIRSVSQGVIGLAVVEALVAGIILLAAGVPGAGLIAFALLILSLVQIGPAPVLLPLVIWAWSAQGTTAAIILTVAAVTILLADNLLKPILIRRGLKTPMLVILAGVIGGTISYGMMGLFMGPVVLAVFYELLLAWVRNEHRPTPLP